MKQPKNVLTIQTDLLRDSVELNAFAAWPPADNTRLSFPRNNSNNNNQSNRQNSGDQNDDDLTIVKLLEGDPIENRVFPESSPAYRMWMSLQNQEEDMTNLRARRVLEVNRRLRIDLNRKRDLASNGCLQLIRFTQENREDLIPGAHRYLEEGDWTMAKTPGCCIIS